MDPSPPRLFDRALQRHRLSRAARTGPATFLFDRAVDDLEERLRTVKRGFARALDLGSPCPGAAERLAALYPDAEVFRLARSAWTIGPVSGRAIVGDEETLPFAPNSFDCVVSLLSLHATNDLPGALVQIRRVLKPDGLFIGCLAGGRTLSELRTAFAIAEDETLGGASPRVAPFADVRELGALLQRAGFALPVADVEMQSVRYRDAVALMRDLRAMGATNAMNARARRPLLRRTLARLAQAYEEIAADPDGRVRASFELIWLSGWAPHASQRPPLKPGSAKMRLADALGVAERKLQRE